MGIQYISIMMKCWKLIGFALLVLSVSQCRKTEANTDDVLIEGTIATAADLQAFLHALTEGSDLTVFEDQNGEISLANDIDMTDIDWKGGAGGIVTTNTSLPNQAVSYEISTHAFEGVFNGNGKRIYNLNLKYDLSDENKAYGFFSALGNTGVIKNLTLSGNVLIENKALQGVAIGGFVGYSTGKLMGCTNQLDIAFSGDSEQNISVRMGGLVGVQDAGQIGDGTVEGGCANEGALSCNAIDNTATGMHSGFHQGGIAGFVSETETVISYAQNKANVSAPTGRGGGIVGSLHAGRVEHCVNTGMIQDDIDQHFSELTNRYNIKRLGGIVGGTNTDTYVTNCENKGAVFSQNGSRTGGFVGHNGGFVQRCTNSGVILADAIQVGNAKHGAAWACGFSGANSGDGYYITECHIGGKVGSYFEYAENPENAPDATYGNAVRHGDFDPNQNFLSNTDDAYYAWTLVDSIQPVSGVIYRKYSFVNFGQRIYTIEVDMSNPNLAVETVMANEICPNPNGNENSNNGALLRETLSQTCNRRRSEGRAIIAGINTGFFNSHDGFPRGVHVEEGEPIFVNNPAVRQQLVNHLPGFTLYEDRKISFGLREYTGSVKVAGQEFEFYSVNDTIVRLNNNTTYDANVYTSRYVKTPHEGLTNPIGTQALFIVARNNNGGLKTNVGYQDATVVEVIDGRDGLQEAPYVTDQDEWVLQVTGDKADELKDVLQEGTSIAISNTLAIGGETREIKVHNASMYHYVQGGVYVAPSSESVANTIDPTTNVGTKDGGKTIMLFCIDGRSTEDRGLDFYEAYRVATKLGLGDVIRFDGGGSTTMWLYDGAQGEVVNNVSDSQGERSCMNYLHIRALE